MTNLVYVGMIAFLVIGCKGNSRKIVNTAPAKGGASNVNAGESQLSPTCDLTRCDKLPVEVQSNGTLVATGAPVNWQFRAFTVPSAGTARPIKMIAIDLPAGLVRSDVATGDNGGALILSGAPVAAGTIKIIARDRGYCEKVAHKANPSLCNGESTIVGDTEAKAFAFTFQQIGPGVGPQLPQQQKPGFFDCVFGRALPSAIGAVINPAVGVGGLIISALPCVIGAFALGPVDPQAPQSGKTIPLDSSQ